MSSENENENEKYKKMFENIVYPEVEPRIINKALLEEAVYDIELKGECAHLHQMEDVVFERVEELRLEGKRILRIDFLWILPNLTKLSLNRNKIEEIENLEMLVNLKELDLSFNYIEKIENLEKLENLETLCLFSNQITKIENLEDLKNLQILSLGNNLIETTDGLERFRFMKKLSVLNLAGNPISNKPNFNLALYATAILPGLKYYDYKMISSEDREKAQEMYKFQISEIEDKQEKELLKREKQEKEKNDNERLSYSFVENLNDNQLFESLWEDDDDAKALMSIGKQALLLREQYADDMYEITQEIYKMGLESYEERESEYQEFMENLEEGQIEIQKMGQRIINEFLIYKEKVFEEATIILKPLEMRIMGGEEEDSPDIMRYAEKFDQLLMQFDEHVNSIWQRLMIQEFHLHESIEEVTIHFQRRVHEIVSKFVEQSQTQFSMLRDIALHFCESLTDAVTRFIGEKLALRDFETVPEDLMHCLEDREGVANHVAGMKELHILRIDEREDKLMTRSREFVEYMVDKILSDELDRHRRQILEINSFLELMSDNLTNLQFEIREELANEEA